MSECWIWTTGINKHGYAYAQHEGKRLRVHRISYEYFVGPIPKGLEIDHLCRNKACANPEHLEAVTHAENMRRADFPNTRKITCPQGHGYTVENTYITRLGKRMCRTCHREREAVKRQTIRREA